MKLSDAQKAAVGEWVEAGAELGEIQTRLKEEFEISITYLDTRFLLGDLGLELMSEREVEEPEEEAPAEDTPPEADEVLPPEGAETLPPAADELPVPGGNVTVVVDSIAQPHALVSGKVTFSDGKTAGWYLDQMGQLGLDPADAGHTPSQSDIAAFQVELQNVLQKQGF